MDFCVSFFGGIVVILMRKGFVMIIILDPLPKIAKLDHDRGLTTVPVV